MVLAVIADDVLNNLDVVTELTTKVDGHPYFVGKLALINALRAMVQSDLRRFARPSPSAAPDEPPAAP